MATGTVGNTAYTQLSPLDDPAFAAIFQQILSSIPQNLPGIQSLVSGGMNSPLLQEVLGPMLARLQQPQAQQREQFTEATRAAGGLRGSDYGSNMNKLMVNQGESRNDLMAQVVQQILGTLVQGQLQSQQQSFLPAQTGTNLLNTARPSTVTGNMAAGGGAGGAGGSGGAGVGGAGGFWSAHDPYFQKAQAASTDHFWNVNGPGSAWVGNAPPAPSKPPPQYEDPWAPQGPYGGGSYNVGAGPQYLQPPQQAPQSQLAYNYGNGWTNQDFNTNFNAQGFPQQQQQPQAAWAPYQQQDSYGYTAQDWAEDPFYGSAGW